MPVTLRYQFAPSLSRLHEHNPERYVGTHKMILGSPPFQVNQKGWGLLSGGPGAACERCHAMTDGQIHPLNKSGVESSRETQPLQTNLESVPCPQTHHRRNSHQLTTPVAFLHLTIDQLRRHLPLECFPPSATHLKPVSKMGGEGIEIHI